MCVSVVCVRVHERVRACACARLHASARIGPIMRRADGKIALRPPRWLSADHQVAQTKQPEANYLGSFWRPAGEPDGKVDLGVGIFAAEVPRGIPPPS